MKSSDALAEILADINRRRQNQLDALLGHRRSALQRFRPTPSRQREAIPAPQWRTTEQSEIESTNDPRAATMRRHRAYYRTRDGRADYYFSFEEQSDGSWRAYIEQQPEYGSRPTGSHETHRLSDGQRRYVCWTTSLESLEDAKHVAALWADSTQDYIRTGRGF